MALVNFRALVRHALYDTPPPVVLLPGEVFFVQSLAVPGVSLAERVALARLALEEASPFPPEQLAWGIYSRVGESTVLIFAAARERLRTLGCKLSEGALYTLPAFFAAFAVTPFSEKTVRFFVEGATLSVLLFEAGALTPRFVQSFPLDAEAPLPPQLEALQEQQTARYQPQGYTIERGCLVFKTVNANRSGEVTFELEAASLPHGVPHVIPYNDSALLWAADVREEGFKAAEGRKRLLDRRLAYVLGIFSVFMVLLFMGELGRLTGLGLLHLRESALEAERPAVEVALEHQRLLDHIHHIYEYCLAPFTMLDVLNEVRPKGLYFTQFFAEDATHAEVKGFGASVDQVNEYAAILLDVPSLVSADLSDVQTRQGKVQFFLKLVFKPLADNSPIEPALGDVPLPPEGSLPPETLALPVEPTSDAPSVSAPASTAPAQSAPEAPAPEATNLALSLPVPSETPAAPPPVPSS